MITIKKHGFLTVSYFVQDGIKKVRQFIKSGMIQDLVNVMRKCNVLLASGKAVSNYFTLDCITKINNGSPVGFDYLIIKF